MTRRGVRRRRALWGRSSATSSLPPTTAYRFSLQGSSFGCGLRTQTPTRERIDRMVWKTNGSCAVVRAARLETPVHFSIRFLTQNSSARWTPRPARFEAARQHSVALDDLRVCTNLTGGCASEVVPPSDPVRLDSSSLGFSDARARAPRSRSQVTNPHFKAAPHAHVAQVLRNIKCINPCTHRRECRGPFLSRRSAVGNFHPERAVAEPAPRD